MRYEVTFRKSFNSEGKPVDLARSYLRVPDTVIEDALLVRTDLPGSLLHPEEQMEEDDQFENRGQRGLGVLRSHPVTKENLKKRWMTATR